jgi:hypothetical protein
VDALARIPQIVKDENEFLTDQAGRAWKMCFDKQTKGKISFRRRPFKALSPALQFRLLNSALNRIDPASGMLFESWKNLQTSLSKSCYRYSFPKGIEILLTPEHVTLYKNKNRP